MCGIGVGCSVLIGKDQPGFQDWGSRVWGLGSGVVYGRGSRVVLGLRILKVGSWRVLEMEQLERLNRLQGRWDGCKGAAV